MRTLHLRNVSDEVAGDLEVRAKREGMSVSAFAVRELTTISRRAHNAAVLAELPSLDIDPEDIVAALHEGRSQRDRP